MWLKTKKKKQPNKKQKKNQTNPKQTVKAEILMGPGTGHVSMDFKAKHQMLSGTG